MGIWERGWGILAWLREVHSGYVLRLVCEKDGGFLFQMYAKFSEQMFWVSWGQSWCTKWRDAALKSQGWHTSFLVVFNCACQLSIIALPIWKATEKLYHGADWDRATLARGLQDSRAAIKQRWLRQGLQLQSRNPNESGKEMQSVVNVIKLNYFLWKYVLWSEQQ